MVNASTFAAAWLCLAALSGCSNTRAAGFPTDAFGTFNNGRIVVRAEGGIAALSIVYSVTHDDRAYGYSQRRICNAPCGVPIDTASGHLSPAATDSLFNIVVAQSPFALADDYGATPRSADMMTYTVTVVMNGTTKTIRADDGTMPAQLRQIVQSVHEIVDNAIRLAQVTRPPA